MKFEKEPGSIREVSFKTFKIGKRFLRGILEIIFFVLYVIGFIIQLPFYILVVKEFERIFSDFKEISRKTLIIIKEYFTF